jgi:hypothetical protein
LDCFTETLIRETVCETARLHFHLASLAVGFANGFFILIPDTQSCSISGVLGL